MTVTSPPQIRDTGGTAGRFRFFVFCLYTFILVGRPQDYIPTLAPLRLALVFTAVSAIVTLLAREQRETHPLHNVESRLYLAFFCVMCAGIPFAMHRRAAYDFVIWRYLANVVFYVLFVINVNTPQRLKRVVIVLMLSALAFSIAGLTQGHFSAGRFYTGSEMFDPNDVPFVEISLLSFSAAMVLGSFRLLAKAVALVSIGLAVLLSLYSGSRGGFLGLATYLALFLIIGLPQVKKTRKVLIFAVLGIVALTNADKINLERYETLTDLQDDYNFSDEFGRQQIWQRGLRLFSADPLTGVGVACFGRAIGTMRAQEAKVPYWQDPHNSFVQVLAETGFFGAAAFLLLVVACIANFNALRHQKEFLQTSGLPALSGLMLIGFLSLLVSGFFLSQAYSVPFTLFFAVSASLRRIAAGAAQAQTVTASVRMPSLAYRPAIAPVRRPAR